MDIVNTASNLIANLGFPIACVAVMFWQMNEERKAHKEESQSWVDALNRNSAVMEKVLAKLEGVEK